MMLGGATALLEGDDTWNGPGGGTAHIDPDTGESVLVFHARNLAQDYIPSVWLKQLAWTDDWPTVQ